MNSQSDLRLPRTEGLSEEERRLWVERVSDHLQSGKVGELETKYKKVMKVHVLSHDRSAAEASVMEKRGLRTVGLEWLKHEV